MANLQLKGMEDAITCSICSELFTDTRTLPCDHCFCLDCLRTFQCSAVIKPCPICRKDTVPAARELHRLPSNKAVNEMVGLLVRHKEKSGSSTPTPTTAARMQRSSSEATGITLAELLGGAANARILQQQRAEAQKEAQAEAQKEAFVHALAQAHAQAQLEALAEAHAKAQAEARAEAVAEALAEAFMGILTTNDESTDQTIKGDAQLERLKTDQIQYFYGSCLLCLDSALTFISVAKRHTRFTAEKFWQYCIVKCNECGTNNISGARYKCGICDDYDLCESCEKKPRQLVHDRTHIFIKFRRPVNKSIPHGRVLDLVALGIGRNMNYDSNVQTFRHPLDILGLISAQVPIDCDRCGEKPIVGKRFKCGMCEGYDLCEDCESDCTSFHPSDHVFLVIRHPSTQTGQGKRLTRCNFY